MRNGSAVCGPNTTNKILYGLIFLAMFMSLGHHIDHVIRGNHVGWPLTEHATPFTYSLVVYPLIFLGLYLYASGRVGAGYWVILSGSGALFVAAIHFGPSSVEPPAEIIDLYEARIVGWLAFGWLVIFVMVLVATCMSELRSWFAQRETLILRPRGGKQGLCSLGTTGLAWQSRGWMPPVFRVDISGCP